MFTSSAYLNKFVFNLYVEIQNKNRYFVDLIYYDVDRFTTQSQITPSAWVKIGRVDLPLNVIGP